MTTQYAAAQVDNDPLGIIRLTRELLQYPTMVVGQANGPFFERLAEELPLTYHRFASGESFNGWTVPDDWTVVKATVSSNGQVLFDGLAHALGVAMLSKSFHGTMSYEQLSKHVATHQHLADAYVFHCMWQYRPWERDWTLCIPRSVWEKFPKNQQYEVSLETKACKGEMLVAECYHRGATDETIVFNAHTCHPHQANDAMVGVVTLVRLFQWLQGRSTRLSYRLILGPEHLGTVFYLRDRTPTEIDKMVGGVYAEMLGTQYPLKAASSFVGHQAIDRAIAHALHHKAEEFELVEWRKGAGNDETVWEAPGYEVPFVELTRARSLWEPYPEYHTSCDTAESLYVPHVYETFDVLKEVVTILEENRTAHRLFDGIICLSNPEYDLYVERPDPTVQKKFNEDFEKWGYLGDCILRYFDGSLSVLDIAEKHGLPFSEVLAYIKRFEAKKLVTLEPVGFNRTRSSRRKEI